MDDETSSLVVDIGSCFLKAGYGRDDSPRAVFPSIFGKSLETSVFGYSGKDLYIGDEANYQRSHLELFPILKNGLFSSKDEIVRSLHHTFYNEINCTPQEYNVLMTEAFNLPKSHRSSVGEVLFEEYSIEGLHFEYAPVLEFYSHGKLTGTNLECGHEFTSILSMVDGYVNPHSIQKHNIGGKTITEYLTELLTQIGVYFFRRSRHQIVQDIKDKLCFFSKNYEKDSERSWKTSQIEKPYQLPDGSVITLNEHRFKCYEPYYDPSIFGFEFNGIDRMIHDSISKFNTELQMELYKNIILNGGVANADGFLDRLSQEISKNIPKTLKNIEPKFHLTRPKFTSWVGGTILSSMSHMKSCWIKKFEYEEKGQEVLFYNSIKPSKYI